MPHIFLIGFMGAGKTRIGQALAKSLGLPFYDLDQYVEMESGLSVSQIFNQYGESEFRKLESSALYRLSTRPHSVVALGGGTPCFYDNMDFIRKSGKSIYLKTTIEVLASRLKAEKDKRPLISKLTNPELKKSIEKRMQDRLQFYEQCDYTVDSNKSLEEVVQAIIGLLKEESSL